jgi:transposase-like protein
MGKWRRHSREFKRQAVERMKTSDNIHELARELQVERKLLYSWKYQFEGRPEKNHSNYAGRAADETVENRLRRENKELKEALGQKAAELDFFAAALRRVNQPRQPSESSGGQASTPKSTRRPPRKAD